MKHSKFKEEASALGYNIRETGSVIVLTNKDESKMIAKVSKKHYGEVDTTYTGFTQLKDIQKSVVSSLVFDLATTPLEEREDEKRFKLKMIGLSVNNSFVNLRTQEYGEEEYIIDDMFEGNSYQTIFTDKDILKMPENIQKAIELGIITKIQVIEVN